MSNEQENKIDVLATIDEAMQKLMSASEHADKYQSVADRVSKSKLASDITDVKILMTKILKTL